MIAAIPPEMGRRLGQGTIIVPIGDPDADNRALIHPENALPRGRGVDGHAINRLAVPFQNAGERILFRPDGGKGLRDVNLFFEAVAFPWIEGDGLQLVFVRDGDVIRDVFHVSREHRKTDAQGKKGEEVTVFRENCPEIHVG